MRHLSQIAVDMLAKPMGYFSDISETAGPYPTSVTEMKANEEQTFYVPLIDCALVTNHIFGGGLRSDLYLRVWFRGPSAFYVADDELNSDAAKPFTQRPRADGLQIPN